MHHEYKRVDEDYEVYEVDGDNEKLVLTVNGADFHAINFIIQQAQRLQIEPQLVYRMLNVTNRYHCPACVRCPFWNDERHHCQMMKPCIKAQMIHERKVIDIDSTLQRVRYTEPNELVFYHYVTISGQVLDRVHDNYFKCLQYLAENEHVIGCVEI